MIFDRRTRNDIAKNPEEWCSFLGRAGDDKDFMKEIKDWKYHGFFSDARKLQIPEGLGEWADTKRELLIRYFPKFREGRKQDLRGYADVQVGRIYMKFISEAEKRKGK
jgi:hypothetical protein